MHISFTFQYKPINGKMISYFGYTRYLKMVSLDQNMLKKFPIYTIINKKNLDGICGFCLYVCYLRLKQE
jgi:hypothetical protein